jgi:diguanylate cyclase (GGDEF)-like protein
LSCGGDGTIHSGLNDALCAHFAMLTRYKLIFSVVILDIDHFQQVNDERGRVVGDQVLRTVAELLGEAARETDVVVRYGGDKFFVLMPQTDLEGACEFSERFRETIQRDSSVTVTGGIATALDGDTPGSLLSRADEALEAAKRAGRNCVFRGDGCRIEPILEDFVLSSASESL